MDSEQNDTGLFQRFSPLNGDLPEVLVERQYDTRFRLGQVQEDDVLRSREIRPGPQNIVTVGSKSLDDRLREVLVGEEAHLRWNRVRLVFVGEIAGVRQTGKDVVSGQARVVGEDFAFRLAGGQEFQDELDRETRAANYRLARQNLRIDDDALRQRHKHSLPCQWPVR
jgi:hypothetical protein